MITTDLADATIHAVNILPVHRFSLTDKFIADWKTARPPWGPLGEVTYRRTYSRLKADGKQEDWWETVRRVVEGAYTYQKWHCASLGLPWRELKAQHSAQTMYRLIFEMKFLPPGRGLWMCGTEYIERIGSAGVSNCAFVSTANINQDFSDPFTFLMDFSMLGVGVGGDCAGAGKVKIKAPILDPEPHVVADTREGWVDLIRRVLDSYVGKATYPECVDYSLVRAAGQPIKGFGGVSAGPEPLKRLVAHIDKTLSPITGQAITSKEIVDLFCQIGVCVVAGNVRRSAIIMLGAADDQIFTDLKNPATHQDELNEFRWASNNSIFAEVGQDYSESAARTARNGEPGYFWLRNARAYGRMGEEPTWADRDAKGTNPCFTGDTYVWTADGHRKFSELAESGADVSVLTQTDEGKLVYRTMRSPRMTRQDQSLVRVVFDNGTHVDCTPDHRFFLTNGQTLEAQHLLWGHSVSSVYRSKANQKGYMRLTNGRESPPLEHHVPFEPAVPEGFDVHHKNGIKDDNRPSNLKLIESSEHNAMHMRGDLNPMRNPDTAAKVVATRKQNGTFVGANNPRYRSDLSDVEIAALRESGMTMGAIAEQLGCSQYTIAKRLGWERPTNHRVVSVEPLVDRQDVYCGTVDETGKFFVSLWWDEGVLVSNCSEQTLCDHELCTLVETFPSRHESYEEYQKTLKFAYLYAKSITLVPTHNPTVNARVMRNRRIGCSQSGIVDSFARHGKRAHLQWCDEGYSYLRDLDRIYSDWLCVPLSRKITSVKPSGTVSLLPGVSPGIHYPHAEYYYRTIRIAKNSPLVKALIKAGYRIEDAVTDLNTVVAYFPVHEEHFDRSKDEVTMWEQLENAAALQQHWADNQVSVTVTFKAHESADIKSALELYETRLKGVSFLPLFDHGYQQAPYQTITEDEYLIAVKKLKPINFSATEHETTDAYCDGDVCNIPLK